MRNYPFKLAFFTLIIITCCQVEVFSQKKKKIRRQQTVTVINTAKSYLGTPYRYGGTSGNGIDCSGLMLKCFEKVDYKLPRTAKDQSRFGKKVGKNGIKPGDVVFFKFRKKGKSWYHSGLVTSVDGNQPRFIHASTSRGVVESNLTEDYYRKNVKGFRRVIR